ncbi:MAG: energy-coupling factor ABC transporter permease [Candidatus Omnitrophica bacterium]|nr:energy-coupling factor ABC transporter permease [Candidatus Omnitrophota bacterium]
MHIPNSMMGGAICPVTAAVSVLGVGGLTLAAMKFKDKPSVLRFASVSAFIFAAQMMNFPVQNGTSGHFLGGVLATALLGIPFGVLAAALVLLVQCLVFSDGGFSVLGANILNMALIGAAFGGFLYKALPPKFSQSLFDSMMIGLAAWFSVMLAAFACSLELAFSGTIPFSKIAGAMISTHAVIGIGEGLMTILAYHLFSVNAAKRSSIGIVSSPFLSAIVIGGMLSPFASRFPDGLMWVAEKYQFIPASAPAFLSPFTGYAIPLIQNELLSGALAGFVGVVITFLAAWLLSRFSPMLFLKKGNENYV